MLVIMLAVPIVLQKCQSMRWEIMTSLCSHSEYGSITGQTRWKLLKHIDIELTKLLQDKHCKFGNQICKKMCTMLYLAQSTSQCSLNNSVNAANSAKHASGNGGIQHTLSSGRTIVVLVHTSIVLDKVTFGGFMLGQCRS